MNAPALDLEPFGFQRLFDIDVRHRAEKLPLLARARGNDESNSGKFLRRALRLLLHAHFLGLDDALLMLVGLEVLLVRDEHQPARQKIVPGRSEEHTSELQSL